MAPRVPEHPDFDDLLLDGEEEEEEEDPALVSTVVDDVAPDFVPRAVTPPPFFPSLDGITIERLCVCLARPGINLSRIIEWDACLRGRSAPWNYALRNYAESLSSGSSSCATATLRRLQLCAVFK